MAYRPASFKGIRFHVLDVSPEKGKRLEVNEFHGRDTPYTESHGRKARKWNIRGFLLGPGAAQRGIALAAAFEAPGAGALILPSELPQIVEGETCRHVQSWNGGNMVELDLSFVEKGSAPGLTVTALPGLAALSAASSLVSLVAGTYTTALAALDQIGLGILAGTVLQVAGNLAGLFYSVSDTSAHAAVNLAIIDLQASSDPATAAATALPVIVAGMSASGAGSTVFADPAAVFPPNVEADAACLVVFIRRLFIIEEARALCATPLRSRDQADALRSGFITRMDAQIEETAVAREGEVLAGLRKVQANTVRDLIERGRPLPTLQTVTLGRRLPAVVVAHRLYQDASRASELVDESGAVHPGFMPPTIRALSA